MIPLIPLVGGVVLEATTGIGTKAIRAITGKKSKSSGVKKRTAASKTKSAAKAGVKTNGTLKKGFRYAKGGRVVKAKGK